MQTNSTDTVHRKKGQLLVCRQSPNLRQTLWRLIREAKGGDPLAPVTVVGPSTYVNLNLRQDLGRCGFANVRFIVMSVLSELLGGAALARMRRKPLPAVLQSVLVREVLAEAGGPLASVRDHPATQASVRASFRELRQVGEKILNSLAARGDVRKRFPARGRDVVADRLSYSPRGRPRDRLQPQPVGLPDPKGGNRPRYGAAG